MGIRKRNLVFSASIVVMALAVIVGLVAAYMRNVQKIVEEDIQLSLREVAAQSVSIVRERIDNSRASIEDAAENIGHCGLPVDDPSVQKLLERYTSRSVFYKIVVADTNGDVYGAGSGKQANIAHQPYFKAAMRGQSNVVNVRDSFSDGREVILAEAPIRRNGMIVGLVIGRCHIDKIQDILNTKIFQGQGYSYLARSSGKIFAMPKNPLSDPTFHDIKTDFSDAKLRYNTDLSGMLEEMRLGGDGVVFYRWNGTDRLMNYAPVGIEDWYLLTVVPQEVITSRSAYLYQHSTFFMAAILAVLCLLILYAFHLQRHNQRRLRVAHKELTTLYNTIPGGIFRCKADENWSIISANDRFYSFLGYNRKEYREKHKNQFRSTIYREDLERVQDEFLLLSKERAGTVVEERLICADGSLKWVWVSSECGEDEDGNKICYCVFLDITEQKKLKERMDLSQQRFEIIIEQTQDTIFEWNIKERQIYYSKNFRRKFGYDPVAGAFPDSIAERNLIPQNDRAVFWDLYHRAERGEKYAQGEFRIRKVGGDFIWCKISLTTILDEHGTPSRAVGVISDIEEQKRRLELVEESARRDPLTKLYNKGVTETLIQEYLAREEGHAAFLVVDIDDFKGINDTMGHLYGDAVLSELARSLKALFRASDVVGRIGGDEFVIFLPNVQEGDILHKKARELSETFLRASPQAGVDYQISGSVGIAFYPRDGNSYAELFGKADTALYYAKKHGKNRYAIYNKEVAQESSVAYGGKLSTMRHPVAKDNPQKNFRENISDYIFRILFENPDLEKSIPMILGLVGKVFGSSRIYICEFSADETRMSVTFEWCAEGIEPRKEACQNMTTRSWTEDSHLFDENNIFYCSDEQPFSELGGICLVGNKSVSATLVCCVVENHKRRACIGFEQPEIKGYPLREEMDVISLLSNIISLFLLRSREYDSLGVKILNTVNISAYVVSRSDYSLLYLNREAAKQFARVEPGDHCYQLLRGNEEPCPDCPMLDLMEESVIIERELYYAPANYWAKASTSLLNWKGNADACLICCKITKLGHCGAREGRSSYGCTGGLNI